LSTYKVKKIYIYYGPEAAAPAGELVRQRHVMIQRVLGQPHIVLPVADGPAQPARELVIHGARLPVLLPDVVAKAAALHEALAALLAGVLVRQRHVLPEQVLLVGAKLFATLVAGKLFLGGGFFAADSVDGGHVGLQGFRRGEFVLAAGARKVVSQPEVIPEFKDNNNFIFSNFSMPCKSKQKGIKM
jgi:hypothetical protein